MKDTLDYFMSLNLPLMEIYGMSETSGMLMCAFRSKNGEDEGHTLDIAPISEETSLQKRSCMRYGTRFRWISQFYLHTHAFIHEYNEPYGPYLAAFAFRAEAGPHLPTTDGWKAELA